MTLEFAKRIASKVLKRGGSAIRFKPEAISDISKALTREDIKRLINDGSIIALPAKHNMSQRSKILRQKRAEGRKRGHGRRKGTLKARSGGTTWEKKVRSQRLFLNQLRDSNKIDNKQFRKFYLLIKGNAFASKGSMILYMKERGITVSEAELGKMNENIKKLYQ